MKIINHMLAYFSEHVMFGHTIHFLGGFGLALVIQQYYAGNAFLSVWVGWALLAIALAGHIMAAIL